MSLLKSLFKREPKPVSVPNIRYGLSLEEFRAEPSNISQMRAFLDSPLGRKVVSVLHFHRPRGFPVRGKSDIESAALEHMRSEGHEAAIMLIEAMGIQAEKQSEMPVADFGVEDYSEEDANP